MENVKTWAIFEVCDDMGRVFPMSPQIFVLVCGVRRHGQGVAHVAASFCLIMCVCDDMDTNPMSPQVN